LQRYNQIVENAVCRNAEEFFKKFSDLEPEADNFQKLISSSFFTDNSNYLSGLPGKIFTKID